MPEPQQRQPKGCATDMTRLIELALGFSPCPRARRREFAHEQVRWNDDAARRVILSLRAVNSSSRIALIFSRPATVVKGTSTDRPRDTAEPTTARHRHLEAGLTDTSSPRSRRLVDGKHRVDARRRQQRFIERTVPSMSPFGEPPGSILHAPALSGRATLFRGLACTTLGPPMCAIALRPSSMRCVVASTPTRSSSVSTR